MRALFVLAVAGPMAAFTPNHGQFDRACLFAESAVCFHATGFRAGWASLEFAGSALSVEVAGEKRGRAVTNYLAGARPVTNVPVFGRLRYRGLYPGVDAVFYRNAQREVELDFELGAGVDPSVIRLLPNAAAHVTADGALAWAGIRLRAPVSFQGSERRPSRFVLRDGLVTIAVDAVDHRRKLTIDPVLEASTFLGGSGGGSAESIAVGPDGSIFVTGTTNSNNQPVKNPMQELFLGSYDFFISKFDPSGRELIYSTYLGTWGDDRAIDIAVDAAGAAHIVGYTNSTELPVVDAVQPAYAGGSVVNGGDVYVVKLSPEGDRVAYATYLGGTLDDFGRSIALDGEGRAWIAGSTLSLDFPLVRPLQSELRGNREGFLACLSADGKTLEFSTYLGGTLFDEVTQLAVGPGGDLFAVGSTQSTDFPLVEPLRRTYGGGVRDAFVLRLRADASAYDYATYLGGTGEDQGRGIAVDEDGNAYVTGFAGNGTFPVANAFAPTFRGGTRDFFLSKLNPAGAALVYSTFLGGSSTDEGFSIALTPQREAVVTGLTQSLNFQTRLPYQAGIGTTTCRTTPCTADLGIAKFAADGRSLVYSTYFGGTGADQSRGVAITPSGSVCVAGFTGSPNLPLANPLQDRNFGGGANVPFLSCLRDE